MTLRSKSSMYDIIYTLSQKSGSQVYLAFKKNPNYPLSKQKVILKIFNSSVSEIYPLELSSLLQVQSPYCISVLHFEDINRKPSLILEWVDGVNLFQFLRYNPSLDEHEVHCICWQIQQGLIDLKKNHLCHGDLSLQNILLDKKGQVRLIDFGKGNYLSKNVFGTEGFISKEVMEGAKPNFNSDLFSLGLIEKTLNGDNLLFSEETPPSCSIDGDPLLDSKPNRRTVKEYVFNSDVQKQLGHKVKKLTQDLKRIEKRTAGIHKHRKTKYKPPLLMLMSILLFSFISSGIKQTEDSSSLNIRSHYWLHITLGNKKGFTPFDSGLLLPGKYEIEWRNGNKQGFRSIIINKGEHIILTGEDLLMSNVDTSSKSL